MPLCPYFLNVNGLGISGPGNPCRTMTSPCTLPSIGSPAYFESAGFGSNVSTWLQPPPMNSEMTAVARGLKCGGFAAYGLTPTRPPDMNRQPIRLLGGQQALTVEQVGQRQPADAAARAEQEFATVPEISAAAVRHLAHLIYRNSSRFRTTCVNDSSDCAGDQLGADGELARRSPAAPRRCDRRSPPASADRLPAACTRFGEERRLRQHERIVQQRERLRRHRRHVVVRRRSRSCPDDRRCRTSDRAASAADTRRRPAATLPGPPAC